MGRLGSSQVWDESKNVIVAVVKNNFNKCERSVRIIHLLIFQEQDSVIFLFNINSTSF